MSVTVATQTPPTANTSTLKTIETPKTQESLASILSDFAKTASVENGTYVPSVIVDISASDIGNTGASNIPNDQSDYSYASLLKDSLIRQFLIDDDGELNISQDDYNFHNFSISDAEREHFQSIVIQALALDDELDPVSFIENLNDDGKKIILKAQGLPETTDLSALDGEGAINLLLPKSGRLDLDNDGVTKIANNRFIGSPVVNAPEEVQQAYEAALETQGSENHAITALRFYLRAFPPTIEYDSQGNVSKVQRPNAIYPTSLEGWQELLSNTLTALNNNQANIPPVQFVREHNFLSTFQNGLIQPSSKDGKE